MKRTLSLALLCVLMLGSCSKTPAVDPTTEPSMVVNGNSQFTAEGIKDVKASRQAHFDVSSQGVVEMTTDTIRIRPGVPPERVDHIDIFYNFPVASDANPEIARAADELGFRFLDDVEPIGTDFKDGSGKESWNPGLGNSPGTVFFVEAILNHTTGSLLWIYSIHLGDRYYTPAATAEIAATGDFTRS